LRAKFGHTVAPPDDVISWGREKSD